MTADVIWFFSIYLIVLFFIFVSGFYFLKLFKNSFFINGVHTGNFVALLTGLIIVVFVFSVFRSRFLTVSLFLPLVALLSFYGKKIRLSSADNISNTSPVLYLHWPAILLIILPFAYFSLVLFKQGDFHFRGVEYDNAVYAELSGYLDRTGTENKWFMFFSDTSSVKGIEPYHYLELWLNACVSRIFGTNLLLSLYLVTYPLLVTVSGFGILAIIEQFKKPAAIDFLLAFFLLTVGPVYQIKNHNYHFNTLACEIPLQQFGEKFSVYYPFIILGILLVKNGYFKEALVWLLSLCVVSSTTLPAIFLFFSLSIPWWWRKEKKLLYKSSLFFTLLFTFYALLTLENYSSGNSARLLSYTDLDTAAFTFQWFKLSVSNFAHAFKNGLLHFSAVYFYAFPLLLIAAVFKKNGFARSLLCLTIICFCGLLCACFFYKLPDSYQLFTNTLPLLHVVVITVLIILLYAEPVKRIHYWITLIFIFIFSGTMLFCSLGAYYELSNKVDVSDNYLLRIKQLLAKDPAHQKIGLIYNQADYTRLSTARNSNYLYHLAYLNLDVVPLQLSGLEVTSISSTPGHKNNESLAKKHDLFYKFCSTQPKAEQHPDSLKDRFIRTYRLKYLLLSPTAEMPAFLMQKNPVIISDPNTGVRFVCLRPF